MPVPLGAPLAASPPAMVKMELRLRGLRGVSACISSCLLLLLSWGVELSGVVAVSQSAAVVCLYICRQCAGLRLMQQLPACPERRHTGAPGGQVTWVRMSPTHISAGHC